MAPQFIPHPVRDGSSLPANRQKKRFSRPVVTDPSVWHKRNNHRAEGLHRAGSNVILNYHHADKIDQENFVQNITADEANENTKVCLALSDDEVQL